MAEVVLKPDVVRSVADSEDISVEVVVYDLPNVCIRCGAPATHLEEFSFSNGASGGGGGGLVGLVVREMIKDQRRGIRALIHAPVCSHHPFIEGAARICALCIVSAVLLLIPFVLILCLLPNTIWSIIILPMFVLLGIAAIASGFAWSLFDVKGGGNGIQEEKVRLSSVSPKFASAYAKHRKAQKQQEEEIRLRRTGADVVLEDGKLVVPGQEKGPPAGKKRGKKRKLKRGFAKLPPGQRVLWTITSILIILGPCGLASTILLGHWAYSSLVNTEWWQNAQAQQNAKAPPPPRRPKVNLPPPQQPKEEPPPQQQPKEEPPPPEPIGSLPDPNTIAGLIAHWPLDEGAGTEATDKSANHLKATLKGGEWVDGIKGKALRFNGVDQYLDLGTSPVLNFAEAAPFSITGWTAAGKAGGPIFSFRNSKSGSPDIDLQVARGRLKADVRADGNEFATVASLTSKLINDGHWHHFALTRQPNGQIQLYLDGELQDEKRGGNSSEAITTDLRALGSERQWVSRPGLGRPYYAGAVDEFCIFNRVLSEDEIRALAGRK